MNGGKKSDGGKPDLGLIPLCALEECAKAFMLGEKKYSRYNFTEGIAVNRLLSAALRHINQSIWESDKDSESNEMHLGHAMASLSMAIYMIKHKPELDDRFVTIKEKTSHDIHVEVHLKAMQELNVEELHYPDNGLLSAIRDKASAPNTKLIKEAVKTSKEFQKKYSKDRNNEDDSI